MKTQIRKPRLKLVPIGSATHLDGAWLCFFGDSKGRVYERRRRKGWRETWFLVARVLGGAKGDRG